MTFLYFAALAYLICCAVLAAAMRDPDTFSTLVRYLPGPTFVLFPVRSLWTRARGGELAVGDPAPDFTLPRMAGGGTVTLSTFRGKRPVLLVFGSYT